MKGDSRRERFESLALETARVNHHKEATKLELTFEIRRYADGDPAEAVLTRWVLE